MEDVQQNIAKLRQAYQLWSDTRGGSADEWLKLFADDVVIPPPGGINVGVGFFKHYRGKSEADDYFSALADSWEVVYFTPEEFIGDGERVVVLSRVAMRCRATGKVAESPKADVFRFRDGAIIEFREFFNTACAVDAEHED
ncbi:MAG: nuclear transport factor 2 family protein [Paludisphaera borealis]|uniref:nuclear transport factor 2 family protein n=1 Tax=Paludisphaera borealis TaxID=1387353 RepID=UPI00284907A4|nr:nuclear transport factor 2 family protein [Paludisphaera borealis]MDR3623302.1 nuclear transport factor 2 family protein [Paludisphaera borealis]